MTDFAYNFHGWVMFRELDKYYPLASEFSNEAGTRPADKPNTYTVLEDFQIHHRLNNDSGFRINIQKALVSNGGTATVTLTNHKLLERLYSRQKRLLDDWDKKQLEMSIVMYHQYPDVHLFPERVNCIFTGDVVDISVSQSSTTLDQELSFRAIMGYHAASRYWVNEIYPSGTTYREIVEDLFNRYSVLGYELFYFDDPVGKLNEVLARPLTVHDKISNVLNQIAKQFDMTWGWDSNPWRFSDMSLDGRYTNIGIPSNLNAINEDKHCYWIDKREVFDVTGIHGSSGTEARVNGISGLRVSGDTGHTGLIGYTKSQFTFNAIFSPAYNVGMPVFADDVRAHLTVQDERAIGRINRVTFNNNIVTCECSYVDPETGFAILEEDAYRTGAYKI